MINKFLIDEVVNKNWIFWKSVEAEFGVVE